MKTTTKSDSKLHKPAMFIPTDYEVVGMFYNRPPQAFYMFSQMPGSYAAEAYRAELAQWEAEKKAMFDDHATSPYACQHCGQTNVAYVAAVNHVPTGERLCFGWQCCDRIGLPLSEFRMRAIKSKAEAQRKREALLASCEAWMAAECNAAAADVIRREKAGEFSRNYFIGDVCSKFWQYGSLSERQAAAIVEAVKREDAKAAAKAQEATQPKGAFPTGRVTITGEVVSTKTQESIYGITYKMLVKADDGNKFWGTIPSSLSPDRGDRVTFTATVEVSKDDAHFGFFSRPTKASIVETKTAEAK